MIPSTSVLFPDPAVPTSRIVISNCVCLKSPVMKNYPEIFFKYQVLIINKKKGNEKILNKIREKTYQE